MSPLSITCLFGHDYRNVGSPDRAPVWGCFRCGELAKETDVQRIDVMEAYKGERGMSNHENVDDMISAVNGMQEKILELITEFGGIDESIAEITERIQATGINAPQGFFQASAQNEQVRVTLSNARHKAQELNEFLESTKDFG